MIRLIRKNRFLLKVVACFFLISLFLNSFAPIGAYALTSGPSAPEYSSFEPVDATDMVNLATGDFSYNIPLFEVPGPEGSYPLNMSYHAGIKNRQEASWVGLGWSLNVGAINRYVNGIADDIYNKNGTIVRTREGKSVETRSYGIGYMGVSYNTSITNDSYRGISTGNSVGVGIGIADGAGVGVSASWDSRGNQTLSIGANGGIPGNSTRGSVGVGYTFVKDSYGNTSNGVSGSVGISQKSTGTNLLGASISSFGGVSTSVLSQNINLSSRPLDVYSRGYSYVVPIPIFTTGFHVNVGHSFKRYYANQIDVEQLNGSLYDDATQDSYSALDPNISSNDLPYNPNLHQLSTLPAYDNFSVLGQGIGGNIQPFSYKPKSFKKKPAEFTILGDEDTYMSFFDNNETIQNKKERLGFRFRNDFSNSYFTWPANANFLSAVEANNYGSKYTIGNKASLNTYAADAGFDPDANIKTLTGSRSIDYYTIDELKNDAVDKHGLMVSTFNYESVVGSDLNTQSYNVENQIGAFKITNKSGVTYHYTIPVYEIEEVQEIQLNDTELGTGKDKTVKSQPYAYTWLLTGITGPDFVDRGTPGVIDNNDWGYWVKFDYGKWTDCYTWRNPDQGTDFDVVNNRNFYSAGTKELYYLDAVSTRSHTALFVKDIRRDGKGVKSYAGGFGREMSGSNILNVSVSSLKLSDIYLIKNESFIDYMSNSQNGGFSLPFLFNYSTELNASFYSNNKGDDVNFHNGESVLDVHDISEFPVDIKDYALKHIKLNHSYNLAKNTPNSFDYNYGDYSRSNNNSGRLTLNSISFLGQHDESIIPPMSFSYFNSIDYVAFAEDEWGYAKQNGITSANKDYALKWPASNGNHKKNWSLSQIQTPLGARINVDYQSDQANVIYGNKRAVYVESFESEVEDNWKCMYQEVQFSSNGTQPTGGQEDVNGIPLEDINLDLYEPSEYDPDLNEYITCVSSYNGTYYNTFKQSNTLNVLAYDQAGNLVTDYEHDYSFSVDENFKKSILKKIKFNIKSNIEPREIKLLIRGIGDMHCGDYDGVEVNVQKKYELDEIDYKQVSINLDDLSPSDYTSTYIPSSGYEIQIFDKNILKQFLSDGEGVMDYWNYDDDFGFLTKNKKSAPFIEIYELVNGYAIFDDVSSSNRGDLRVDFVQLMDPFLGQSIRTNYNYSGGYTFYEPNSKQFNFKRIEDTDFDNMYSFIQNEDELKVQEENEYEKHNHIVAQSYHEVNFLKPVLPGPKVYYSNVTVTSSENPDIKAYYEFTQPSEIFPYMSNYSTLGQNLGSVRYTTLPDFSSRVGLLKKVTQKDERGGNNYTVKETKNKYLFNDVNLAPDLTAYKNALASNFNNQGRREEVFYDDYEIKKCTKTNCDEESDFSNTTTKSYTIFTKTSEYPVVNLGTEVKEYKENKVVKHDNTRNIAFDFYSGDPTHVYSWDYYGNEYMNVGIPAYTIYPGMGPGSVNKSNKNMLTQLYSNTSYSVTDVFYTSLGFTESDITYNGVLSSGIQTWRNDFAPIYQGVAGSADGVYRKHENYMIDESQYTLNSKGYIDQTDFVAFDPAVGEPGNPSWKRISTITEVDPFSKVLEASDLYGNHSSVLMDRNHKNVVASATYADRSQIAYSGCEYRVGVDNAVNVSNVHLGPNADAIIGESHTGDGSVFVSNGGDKGFVFNFNANQSGKYLASAWVYLPDFASNITDLDNVKVVAYDHTDNVEIAHQGRIVDNSVNSWYLIELVFDVIDGHDIEVYTINNTHNFSDEREVYFDDFRVHPYESDFSSFVYDQQTGDIEYIINGGNLYTRFEYENGDLTSIYKEKFGVTSDVRVSKQAKNYGN